MTDQVERSPQTDVTLRAEGISKNFESTAALTDVSFEVRKGEVHALVGENGAGKSTLLRILSGLEVPTAGYLQVGGRTYRKLTPALAQELGILLVPQHVELIEDLSVADNIFLNRWPRHGPVIDQRTMYRDAERILEQVSVWIAPDRLAGDLTYVQKQMVEIARVSEFFSPRVIILDEPTAALSVREDEILFGLIAKLRDSGVGIVYVSHFINEVGRVGDRVTVLRDGRVVVSAEVATLSLEQIVYHMVGNIPDLYPQRQVPKGDMILCLEQVHGDVMRDLTLQIAVGEIVGIAAPKGEGISEFFRSLLRISGAPPLGRVTYKGQQLRIANSADALHQGIGYLSEERGRWGLIAGRSTRENLTLSSLRKYLTNLFMIHIRRELAAVAKLITQFWIKAPDSEAPIEALSGGNQQKVLLARLLDAGLSLYILDDPTFGVDVGSKSEINRLMNRAVESGAAILMHTSDLAELVEMSDRIVLVKGARVVREFRRGAVSPAEIQTLLEAE